jgi:hypothetical protein
VGRTLTCVQQFAFAGSRNRHSEIIGLRGKGMGMDGKQKRRYYQAP